MAKFYILGAGPGDPDLLTIRGARILEEADVVLYDRLVDSRILNLCGSNVTTHYVGKEHGNQENTQNRIFTLFRQLSDSDKLVVRLKGGDPFVFGRGIEEVLYLKELNQEVELIPGLSSSLAVPSICGIPLTARGISQGFAVVTGHCAEDSTRHKMSSTELQDSLILSQIKTPSNPNEHSLRFWRKFRDIDTLVILMGVKNRSQIATNLINAGRSPEEPAAFIENGCSDSTIVIKASLGEIACNKVSVKPPAVFVIGNTVRFFELTSIYNGPKTRSSAKGYAYLHSQQTDL